MSKSLLPTHPWVTLKVNILQSLPTLSPPFLYHYFSLKFYLITFDDAIEKLRQATLHFYALGRKEGDPKLAYVQCKIHTFLKALEELPMFFNKYDELFTELDRLKLLTTSTALPGTDTLIASSWSQAEKVGADLVARIHSLLSHIDNPQNKATLLRQRHEEIISKATDIEAKIDQLQLELNGL